MRTARVPRQGILECGEREGEHWYDGSSDYDGDNRNDTGVKRGWFAAQSSSLFTVVEPHLMEHCP